jgi:stalled ribosome rescue protein Dom34
VLSLDSLDVHASTAQIADAARHGASTLRDASDVRQIDEIAAEARAGGLGVLGREATERALARASVRALFFSERFLVEHAADAATLLRAAIDQDASIEEVTRDASRELDAYSGIAALLRFPLRESGVPLATTNGG